MIQIAIWGIALMLVVKGIDVLHQQKIAERAGGSGSQLLALIAFGISLVGAAGLVKMADLQAADTPATTSLGTP